MTPEFKEKIENILTDYYDTPLEPIVLQHILDAIKHEYEFECPSFVYAGNGHQSKHRCTYNRPHDIAGEHHDMMWEWKGTTVLDGEGKIVFNAPHEGCYCGNTY